MTEKHYNERIGWLRAAVLGANDGIVSTSSLVVGVAAANTDRIELLLASIAGLVAGAMSMAAGEYVSVSSQEDTEKADIEREKFELAHDLEAEHEELANIYIERGLDKKLATRVAEQLMRHDALDAHTRDELGLVRTQRARPILAASSSAISFFTGALLPVLLVVFVPMDLMIVTVATCSLVFLSLLGFIAAKAGGANVVKSMARVTLWGSLAMTVTAAIGNIFSTFI